jgi:hypothetical protein
MRESRNLSNYTKQLISNSLKKHHANKSEQAKSIKKGTEARITDYTDDGMKSIHEYIDHNNSSYVEYSDGQEFHTKLHVSDPTEDYHASNKKYVDDKFNSISKKTEEGGQIFGDTETNKASGQYATTFGSNSNAYGDNTFVAGSYSTAYGDGSIAMGDHALAGCKGYYVAAIDTANRHIYLSTTDREVTPSWDSPESFHSPSFNLGYKIYTQQEMEQAVKYYANEFSVSANAYYHWIFAGDIVAIDGNRITYSETNIFERDKTSDAWLKWASNLNDKAKPAKFYIPA